MTVAPTDGLATGVVCEDWTGDAQFYEYTKAANPIVPDLSPAVPIRTFSAALHQSAETQIVPLDLSSELAIDDGPATSPALCASFIQVLAGERIATAPVATSELYHVIRGTGFSAVDGELVEWSEGDTFVLPANATSTHHATTDAAMYWEPGGAFVTPPGMWHAHVNESGAPAHLFPVQDAGLQTYLRTLDIRFTPPKR